MLTFMLTLIRKRPVTGVWTSLLASRWPRGKTDLNKIKPDVPFILCPISVASVSFMWLEFAIIKPKSHTPDRGAPGIPKGSSEVL